MKSMISIHAARQLIEFALQTPRQIQIFYMVKLKADVIFVSHPL